MDEKYLKKLTSFLINISANGGPTKMKMAEISSSSFSKCFDTRLDPPLVALLGEMALHYKEFHRLARLAWLFFFNWVE